MAQHSRHSLKLGKPATSAFANLEALRGLTDERGATPIRFWVAKSHLPTLHASKHWANLAFISHLVQEVVAEAMGIDPGDSRVEGSLASEARRFKFSHEYFSSVYVHIYI